MNAAAPADPLALHAALNMAADAMNAAESGNRARAYQFLAEAAVQAAGAYPDGDPGYLALLYIFQSIATEVTSNNVRTLTRRATTT